MPSQTKKKPTGKFDRQSLKEYLKKQAKESKVGEDYTVQFIRKVRPTTLPPVAIGSFMLHHTVHTVHNTSHYLLTFE